MSDPPRDSLWVGDMSIDLLWGGGGISGDTVQASNYFYDNAGNLILVNSLGSGTAANVVQNPGFETGDLSNWYGYKSGTGVSDNFDEYEGEYSLVFSGNDSVCQKISLSETVSSPITISCWVEISCWFGEGEFELKCVLKGDGINEEHSSEIIAGSCDWTQVPVTIDNIPEGTSSCEIKLIKRSGFALMAVDNVICELETGEMTETKTKYIYAGNRLLAKEEDGELSFYHLDRIGSPIMITDESGDVLKEKKYEAFGNLVWAEGDYEDNREFTSKEKDPTGFHYFGARYYSGDIGRFLTPDPHTISPGNIRLKDPQTLNPYLYCTNDPNAFVDENGLWRTMIKDGKAYITRQPLWDATVISGTEFFPGIKLASTYVRMMTGDVTINGLDWFSGIIGCNPGDYLATYLSIAEGVSEIKDVLTDRDKLALFTKITGVRPEQDLTGGEIRYYIGNVKDPRDIKKLKGWEIMKDIDDYYDFLDEEVDNPSFFRTNVDVFNAWRVGESGNYFDPKRDLGGPCDEWQ